MYLASIILLMFVLPLLSVAAEAPMLPHAAPLMGQAGAWNHWRSGPVVRGERGCEERIHG